MSSNLGQTWQKGWRLAFNGTNGRKILGSFAQILVDKTLDWGTVAATMRFPSTGDPTAQGMLAHERGLEPGPAEAQASIIDRLVHAIPQWQMAERPLGLALALYYAGFPGAVIATQLGRAYAITSAPTIGDLEGIIAPPSWFTITTLSNANPALPASTDGRPAIAALTIPWFTFDAGMDAAGNQFNSRFGIIFPSGVPDPALGTASNLARIQRTIKKWKPGSTTCVGIVVVSAGWLFDWPIRDFSGGYTFADHTGTATYYAAE